MHLFLVELIYGFLKFLFKIRLKVFITMSSTLSQKLVFQNCGSPEIFKYIAPGLYKYLQLKRVKRIKIRLRWIRVMLSNRKKSFYDKFLAAYEIPTLVGLISIEFPGAYIIVTIGDRVKCFFWLKHYSGRRPVSVVNGKHFRLERPISNFIHRRYLIRIWVLFEIVHGLILMVFIMKFKLLHCVSHLAEPPHQTLWCL